MPGTKNLLPANQFIWTAPKATAIFDPDPDSDFDPDEIKVEQPFKNPGMFPKDRLQNYLIFCFQNTMSFKGFWKQFRSSYFVTIPKE